MNKIGITFNRVLFATRVVLHVMLSSSRELLDEPLVAVHCVIADVLADVLDGLLDRMKRFGSWRTS